MTSRFEILLPFFFIIHELSNTGDLLDSPSSFPLLLPYKLIYYLCYLLGRCARYVQSKTRSCHIIIKFWHHEWGWDITGSADSCKRDKLHMHTCLEGLFKNILTKSEDYSSVSKSLTAILKDRNNTCTVSMTEYYIIAACGQFVSLYKLSENKILSETHFIAISICEVFANKIILERNKKRKQTNKIALT